MTKRMQGLKIPTGVSASEAFVQILDPATGTGTFLVEVIDVIHKTLVAKWKAQGHSKNVIETLWNEYVPKYLLPRLHGYAHAINRRGGGSVACTAAAMGGALRATSMRCPIYEAARRRNGGYGALQFFAEEKLVLHPC
jgi:hypothetical protein